MLKQKTEKVDLMQAFSWICPLCGTRNFERAIRMEMEEEKEKNIKEGITDCNAWVDNSGGLYMAPTHVTCKRCTKKYEVNQGEDSDIEG